MTHVAPTSPKPHRPSRLSRLLALALTLTTFTAHAAQPPSPPPAKVTQLFDGKTLTGWTPTPFGGKGEVTVKDGVITLETGYMTGVNWTNAFPTSNFELSLEAKRTDGNDFFCGLTFPVRDSHATLIVGGWGGALVGISSVNGADASENETTKFQRFEKDRFYKIRLRVEDKQIQAWINDEQIINLDTSDKKLSLRPGDTELCKPMGIATWNTGAALKNIELRTFPTPSKPSTPAPTK